MSESQATSEIDPQPSRMPWIRVLISLVGVLVAYYAAPVEFTGTNLIGPAAVTLVGVGLLTGAIVGQLRRHWFTDSEVRLPLLVTLALLVVAVFAYGYFALETVRPGQMADLETRTDSLYFTLQVLTTVGLGDVHAVGQTARAMVSLQMAFDLVFVAAGGSLLASVIRSRMNEAHTARSETAAQAASARPSTTPTDSPTPSPAEPPKEQA
ncbi:potassium channel family protein [Nocardioides sambongensis]|uniref:potassium channel family protein n=1 Tax=Nocardioides sambongensis TaxID=2589074 RepID=UPI0018C89DF7|nr:potassium channel family protein [Nocardioides sambongensis]